VEVSDLQATKDKANASKTKENLDKDKFITIFFQLFLDVQTV